MLVLVLVLVLMVVRMGMVMTMAMTMTVVMVAVPVIGHMATVGAAFGLKGQVGFDHGHVHAAQHVGEHMVWFDLQVVGLQFNGNVAVAQVVGRTHQVKGCAVLCAGSDFEHALGGGNHTDHGAVFGHQYVTAAHGLTTWQKNGQFTPLAVSGCKA